MSAQEASRFVERSPDLSVLPPFAHPAEGPLKIAIFVLSLLLSVVFVLMKFKAGNTYQQFVQEDGLLEYSQATIYIASSIISFRVMADFMQTSHRLHVILFFLLGTALLFTSLEEISWGQRIFQFPTPGYFRAHNQQGELSLHNLSTPQAYLHRAYIVVGTFGSLGWLALRLLRRSKHAAVAYILPDWYLMFYFAPVAAIYSYFEQGGSVANTMDADHFIIWRDQEPAELLLALGFFLFLARSKLRQSADTLRSTPPFR